MKTIELDKFVDQGVIDGAARYSEGFARAAPFRHVVIDGFFTGDVAARLLADFPPFDRGNALNEAGQPGGKSAVEKIVAISPVFAALDGLIKSEPFLNLVGRITGIDALLYDPYYFGGGTHENRHGQDLDPHVDFNRHPIEHWHRRLNLIVYLNRDWDEAWGGALELHSDPRSPDDAIVRVAPLFNRCVIFETTEWSWHGFSRIRLPPERAAGSRRSIALYFYTRDRPLDELADTHSTHYVDRPLPERFREGLSLTAADVDELKALLARRDGHRERLYRDLVAQGANLQEAKDALLRGGLGRLTYLASRALARLRR